MQGNAVLERAGPHRALLTRIGPIEGHAAHGEQAKYLWQQITVAAQHQLVVVRGGDPLDDGVRVGSFGEAVIDDGLARQA